MLFFFLLNAFFAAVLARNSTKQYIRGFNVANTASGGTGLKNASDWDVAFQTIKSLPGNFNAAKVYSTTDGGPGNVHYYLPDILPMAIKNDIQLMLGLWLGGGVRFQRELQALHDGLVQFPQAINNVAAITVGSEDLYRNETDAATIVGWIAEVRELFQGISCEQTPLITHTDTWDQWIKDENAPLLNAVDFVTVNAFPFWEKNAPIGVAIANFSSAIYQVQTVADKAQNGGGVDVWLGETGWATVQNADEEILPFPQNFNNDQSIGSIENLQSYWNMIMCGSSSNYIPFDVMNSFYYIDRDYWNAQSFGVLGPENKPLINLTCSEA